MTSSVYSRNNRVSLEQRSPELGQQLIRSWLRKLMATEAIDFVARKPEISIRLHHGRITLRAGTVIFVSVVVLAVHLNHNPHPTRE